MQLQSARSPRSQLWELTKAIRPNQGSTAPKEGDPPKEREFVMTSTIPALGDLKTSGVWRRVGQPRNEQEKGLGRWHPIGFIRPLEPQLGVLDLV